MMNWMQSLSLHTFDNVERQRSGTREAFNLLREQRRNRADEAKSLVAPPGEEVKSTGEEDGKIAVEEVKSTGEEDGKIAVEEVKSTGECLEQPKEKIVDEQIVAVTKLYDGKKTIGQDSSFPKKVENV